MGLRSSWMERPFGENFDYASDRMFMHTGKVVMVHVGS